MKNNLLNTDSQSLDQIEQAEKLVENMEIRKNLDLPYNLELLANDIKHLCLLDDSQSPIFSPSLDNKEYNNLINMM
jgi:ABC-type lipoprotein export system ATPase subunit